MHRFDPARYEMLLSPERSERWNPPVLLRQAGVSEGQHVADLGCGPGFWTMPLAGITGSQGQVWAVDVSRELLDVLARRQPPDNVHLIQAQLPDTNLASQSLDYAWAALVVHEIDRPEEFAKELSRIVRPGGHVAIMDWRPDGEGQMGPPLPHRVPASQVICWLEVAGLKDVGVIWEDGEAYVVKATVPDQVP